MKKGHNEWTSSPQSSITNVILILFTILFQIQLINILTAVILINCAIELYN